MDKDVITSFARAIIETFNTMLQVRVDPKQARTKEERVPGDGVHAIIGMNGSVEGAMALSMPTASALATVNAMLDTDYTEIDAIIVDGVQELDNVIIGAARKHLAQAGLDFEFGLPKTMVGIMFTTDEGPQFRNLGINFDCQYGPFLVNLSWRKT